MRHDVEELVSCIYNDCYMVRHYERNQLRRRQAIQKLAETLRFAFNKARDYDEQQAVIGAMLEGLRPRDRVPF